MKTFNLEEAEAGKPIVTRGGKHAKFVAYVPEVVGARRVVVLLDGYLTHYRETGAAYRTGLSDLDLFMAPVKRVVWVVEAKKSVSPAGAYRCAWTYQNENDALAQVNRCNLYTGPYRLEIEE